jgi:hypothetical protein
VERNSLPRLVLRELRVSSFIVVKVVKENIIEVQPPKNESAIRE